MSYLKLKLYRVLHWEYWPMQFIYYPIFPVWLYFAMRARSFFFFSVSNPRIKNGGMAMESKKDIYDMMPLEHYPTTAYLKSNSSISTIKDCIDKSGFTYPLIAKPDIGLKALGVEKIENLGQLNLYSQKIEQDFLIQELITYPKEIGLFYVRKPNEKKGRITGIVAKEFLTVTGDGTTPIVDLIKQNPRAHFQLASLKKKYGSYLGKVLEKDEEFILVPFGSHTRGAKFIDDSHEINEQMETIIDTICLQLPDLHYGRLDIRLTSYEDLSLGKNFSIIEINGAGSEPTHIYDPKHSIFFAWSEIIKHWNFLFQISVMNHKKGHRYLSYKNGIKMLKDNSLLEKRLKSI
ncbi:hypothetical protein LY01_02695 [Nonlabens xylanidelens]|uniref:ATP-grasp domain-containing protein n=1 Tax=Nonlabens xylanidelens TaxID=191564 RepID=A0A2S6IFR5_9FLAO|nr:D-alanine--D-alanine ligase [Nonlabens xylanidelens]PPK92990.1 hypothetical protein LY01_02695 [Nonlabens xylanidelens]PQJ18800.1 D-alanine--D-alanine ligase [Nonlabens xylanidelens]